MFKRFTPDLFVKTIYDIPLERLREMGIRGLIFDLDNTITMHDQLEISSRALKWFKTLKEQGFKVCILSNNSGGRVKESADIMGIECVSRAKKPRRQGFYRAFETLGTKPQETAMVGDQLFTDIWGGNRAGVFTILVEPISSKEMWGIKYVSRNFERIIWPAVKRNLMKNPQTTVNLLEKE
ncbi:MAG: YqeG family HAD IIIA-type phosphatase [Bacillota bacterium]|jgi:HAD superfamily phosphatase (TIGR01668 family)